MRSLAGAGHAYDHKALRLASVIGTLKSKNVNERRVRLQKTVPSTNRNWLPCPPISSQQDATELKRHTDAARSL